MEPAQILAFNLTLLAAIASPETSAPFLSRAALRRRHVAAKTPLDRGAAAIPGALGLRLLADR